MMGNKMKQTLLWPEVQVQSFQAQKLPQYSLALSLPGCLTQDANYLSLPVLSALQSLTHITTPHQFGLKIYQVMCVHSLTSAMYRKHSVNTVSLLTLKIGAGCRDGQQKRAPSLLPKGLASTPSIPESSPLSPTPVPGDTTPSSGLHEDQAYIWYTNMHISQASIHIKYK